MYTQLRNTFYQSIGARPSLFFPIWTALHPRRVSHIQRKTALVIEGFPRSGNSFADAAFKASQPKGVHSAHHIHYPAQIIRAVHWNVPALLLIREPEDAIVSFKIYEPRLSLRWITRFYLYYYRSLLPFREGFVTATFEQVTGDFGLVLQRVNQRFNTQFICFNHSPEEERRVFDILNTLAAERHLGRAENRSGAPVTGSRRGKEELAEELRRQLAPELQQAASLYGEYVAFAGDTTSSTILRGESHREQAFVTPEVK